MYLSICNPKTAMNSLAARFPPSKNHPIWMCTNNLTQHSQSASPRWSNPAFNPHCHPPPSRRMFCRVTTAPVEFDRSKMHRTKRSSCRQKGKMRRGARRGWDHIVLSCWARQLPGLSSNVDFSMLHGAPTPQMKTEIKAWSFDCPCSSEEVCMYYLQNLFEYWKGKLVETTL